MVQNAGPGPYVIAVSGIKNSGKTTLVERLIPALSTLGFKVAVIKHDGHSFVPDTPGTDSFRFFQAGAVGSAVFDGTKFALSKRATVDETALLPLFGDADIVLLEGFKGSAYPKLEIIRKAVSTAPAANQASCDGYISDCFVPPNGLPVFDPDDIDSIARFIAQLAQKSKGHGNE